MKQRQTRDIGLSSPTGNKAGAHNVMVPDSAALVSPPRLRACEAGAEPGSPPGLRLRDRLSRVQSRDPILRRHLPATGMNCVETDWFSACCGAALWLGGRWYRLRWNLGPVSPMFGERRKHQPPGTHTLVTSVWLQNRASHGPSRSPSGDTGSVGGGARVRRTAPVCRGPRKKHQSTKNWLLTWGLRKMFSFSKCLGPAGRGR